MKYIKKYEKVLDMFDFKQGEIVVCINNELAEKSLKLFQEYFVLEVTSVDEIRGNLLIQDVKFINKPNYWGKWRFVRSKYLEEWKVNNATKKYNI